MLRREFFSFASVAAVTAPNIIKKQAAGVGALIEQLTPAIKSEMPDVTSIEVSYDTENPEVPLMILAFRV